MTLPDLLREAARVLPERASLIDDRGWGHNMTVSRVRAFEGWVRLGDVDCDLPLPDYAYMYVEQACREEIKARGWACEVRIDRDGTPSALVSADGTVAWIRPGKAPTPAEAMLSALLAALAAHEANA